MRIKIEPSKVEGTLLIPPSKSHTLRAILFAALADGVSVIHNILNSPDTDAMVEAVRQMGASITQKGSTLEILGFAGRPQTPDDVIQCGNSGLVLRLIGALAALSHGTTILTGDHSIRHNRVVQPLIDALTQLGVEASSSRGNGYAPIMVRGPIIKKSATMNGLDSQPVSALLIASSFAPHPIEIHVQDPGEKPWIDMTLSWLKKRGIACTMNQYTHYQLQGSAHIDPFHYTVPADFSTAAFSMASALITKSTLLLDQMDLSDTQGDKKVISILQQMGASITVLERGVRVEKGGDLQGATIDVNDCIDALPILAVVACFAKGKTTISNGKIARSKESDRISAITQELKKMGAAIEEVEDGVIIEGAPLHGASLESHHDHRIALSLCVASLGANGPSTLANTQCIAKTYPHFCQHFQSIGAKIKTCI